MKGNDSIPQKKSSFGMMFRALRSRNYRLFYVGQTISITGTWMQRVASGWLVYRLTNDPMMLGLVDFASQIPILLLSPFTGVLADRRNKQRIMMVTQSLALLQAVILATLVLTDTIHIWHIIILNMSLGIINSFDMPTRQAFTVQMIEKKEDLGNAIALNSSIIHIGRLIGPPIAGILIYAFNEGVCFAVNALTYVAILVSLLLMNVPYIPSKKERPPVIHELVEGFKYTKATLPIRNSLLFLVLLNLFAIPYIALMPVFVRDVFNMGPKTLGFLTGGIGVGALFGVVVMASRHSARGLDALIPKAAMLFGSGLVLLSLATNVYMALPALALCGMGMMMFVNSNNTLIQTLVHDDKRGRVMSLYTMAFMGIAPFGSLMAGWIAKHYSASITVYIGGVACFIGAFLYRIAKKAYIIDIPEHEHV